MILFGSLLVVKDAHLGGYGIGVVGRLLLPKEAPVFTWDAEGCAAAEGRCRPVLALATLVSAQNCCHDGLVCSTLEGDEGLKQVENNLGRKKTNEKPKQWRARDKARIKKPTVEVLTSQGEGVLGAVSLKLFPQEQHVSRLY